MSGSTHNKLRTSHTGKLQREGNRPAGGAFLPAK